jgi:very-short-patch-repair endonuclease
VLGACTVTVAVGTGRDEVIRRLCRAQRGRVARWQLLDAGLLPDTIDRCLRSGRLIREHEGVYALPLGEQIEWGADAAGILAAGPGARLSHHSAVVLWQLRVGIADPIHVTVPYGRRGTTSSDHLVVHRSRILAPQDLRIHRGLLVTSPARTLLDAAGTLPDRDVERLFDEARFVRRIVTPRQIADMLRRAGGHPGAPRLRRVAGTPTRSRTESRPEERLLQMVLAAGLPPPQTQAHVLGYKLDLFWPQHHLAVEVDTYGTHGSPRRFAADRRRDARLLAERGIVVLRFTDTQIAGRPLEVIATLAGVLGGTVPGALGGTLTGSLPGAPDEAGGR